MERDRKDERGPCPLLALHIDPPVMGICDVLDKGEPEAGPIVFGGEVGVEYPPGDLRRDTVPCIFHQEQEVVFDSHKGYFQTASRRHCIFRILDEVYQKLLELSTVYHDIRELFRTNDGGLGGRIGLKMVGRSAESGGRTIVHAVVAGEETHGKYLSECHVKPEGSWVLSDEGAHVEKRLWAELVDILEGIRPGVTKI